MKNIIGFSILCFLLSCNKETFISENENKSIESEHFLSFDIKNIAYDITDSTIYSLTLKQVENQSFELVDLDKVNRYLWFMPYNIPEDSVAVVGKVAFEWDTELDLAYKKIDLEFSFIEAKSKLEQLSDSTYKYKSLADFYALSNNTSWGEPYDGKAFEVENLLMTVSEPIEISPTYSHYISSNGFYFEDETIHANTSSYNVEEQSMIISGAFNVKIKELSCGFYITHDVKNARFSAKIQ